MAIYGMLYGTTSHPTAEQVWSAIKEQFPAVSFNTVYTTLYALEKCGLVQRLHVGENVAHYDAIVLPHVHFNCKSCGQVSDCEIDRVIDAEKLSDQLARDRGYRLDKLEVNVYGLCRDCLPLQ
jgi:Fur family peroxide stress response transcriptional regulator